MSKKYCEKCGRVHDYGTCPNKPTQKPKRKSYSKTYSQMTEDELVIQKFYNSKEWRKMRDKILARSNGLCVICWAMGIISNAKSVHHIVKLREDFSLRLSEENLIAVCDSCHRAIEDTCHSLEDIEQYINDNKKQ